VTPLQARATQDSASGLARQNVQYSETEPESPRFDLFALSADSHDFDSRPPFQTQTQNSSPSLHSGRGDNITPEQQASSLSSGTTPGTPEQELANKQSMKPFIQHLEPLQRRIQTTMAGRRSSAVDDGEYWCLMVHAGAGYHSKHNENLHLAVVEE
jgi:hypothetical protein